MSSKAVEALVQRAERGGRVAQIRAALKLTGEDFGAKLTALCKAYGIRAKYDRPKVSRMESGGRKLTVEEAAILTMIDPDNRGVGWLVFGERAAMPVSGVINELEPIAKPRTGKRASAK